MRAYKENGEMKISNQSSGGGDERGGNNLYEKFPHEKAGNELYEKWRETVKAEREARTAIFQQFLSEAEKTAAEYCKPGDVVSLSKPHSGCEKAVVIAIATPEIYQDMDCHPNYYETNDNLKKFDLYCQMIRKSDNMPGKIFVFIPASRIKEWALKSHAQTPQGSS